MPSFNEHITQAKRNLEFLKSINDSCNKFWDWQVTTCFYIGVHLVNAHIAQKTNMHYRKHVEVNNSLNPFNQLSPCKLSETDYLSYTKLQNLARRARYLVHDDISNAETIPHFTYDKHFKRSLKHLDNLMRYIASTYNIEFDTISINCIQFNGADTVYFKKLT